MVTLKLPQVSTTLPKQHIESQENSHHFPPNENIKSQRIETVLKAWRGSRFLPFFVGGVGSVTSNEHSHWVLAWIRTTLATCFEGDAVLKKTCCLSFDFFRPFCGDETPNPKCSVPTKFFSRELELQYGWTWDVKHSFTYDANQINRTNDRKHHTK